MNAEKPKYLPAERLNNLREHILTTSESVVELNELAHRFGVSVQTVRRDLDELGAEGLIERTFGGAKILQSALNVEPEITQRQQTALAAKQKLVRPALEQIRPGSAIFFDASTTVLQLIRALPQGIQITATTHSILAAQLLATKIQGSVVLLGGEYRSSADCVGGVTTIEQVQTMGFNQAFISCRTFNTSQGFQEALEIEAALKRIILANTEQVSVLVDGTKVGGVSAYSFGQPSQVDRVLIGDGEWMASYPSLADEHPNIQIIT